MIPIGYMRKRVVRCPEWLGAEGVGAVFSVSRCLSEDFADWIGQWQHNGFWLFDSPDRIHQVASAIGVSLKGTTLFYYEAYEQQYDDARGAWVPFGADGRIPTHVVAPRRAELRGFDVVSYSAQAAAECSPLSCNALAETVAVNEHCLLDSLDAARSHLDDGRFERCEPGPYRILGVHEVLDP